MKKRLLKLFILLAVLVAVTGIVIPLHAMAILHFSTTDKTNADLDILLSNLEWTEPYQMGVFDCSNQAARLCDELRAEGFKCALATDLNHVWVMVKTIEGVQSVEPVTLDRIGTERTARYVMHPSLAPLTVPFGEFTKQEEQLEEKALEKGNGTSTKYWRGI